MWFSAHRDKTNQKNPQKKLLDETNVSALRLRCYCHAKDRKPDAEMQFGANMCHWVFTCEKSPPHNPWMQFLLCEGPFTVWGSFEERCGGGGVATSQTSQNTYNKPWMFLIRLLFILTSAVSWLATIAVTFHHFFGFFFFFFLVFSESQPPTQTQNTHATPAWSILFLQALHVWPFVVSRTWLVLCGRGPGPLLFGPLRCARVRVSAGTILILTQHFQEPVILFWLIFFLGGGLDAYALLGLNVNSLSSTADHLRGLSCCLTEIMNKHFQISALFSSFRY